jgi:YYY domain-containing protein
MQSVLHIIRGIARSPWCLTLLLIVLAALAVRLYALDWDDGADLHPDELFVARIVLIDRIKLAWPPEWDSLVDPARSGLNPRSADPATGEFREFAYGALPLWVTDFVAWILSRLTGENWNGPDRAYLVGRTISAVLSALTVVPVALLGRMVGGWRVGLLAALFATLAPMSIQLAHFFTTDSWLTFFVALCLLACAAAAESGRLGWFLAAGACLGLAMATKGSVFTLAAPIAVAVAVDLSRRLPVADLRSAMQAAAIRGAGAAATAVAAFFLFEPFALLRPDVYLQSLTTQAEIVSGAFDVPFTRVYVGTTPLLYQLEQFGRWGFGPAAGLLALLGLAPLAWLALRGRSPTALVLVGWLIAYGAVLALAEVKFLRYLEPLAPVFAVGAALALDRFAGWARSIGPAWFPRAVVAVPVVLAALWTAAFLSIYAHEHPRVAASHWIYGNVAPGSVVTAEYWDDALPRGFGPALSPASFGLGTAMLDLYRDLPPQEASDAIYDATTDVDYVVQSSQRVEAAIEAAPWRYPVQGRFFDQLARGALGFDLAASFRNPPAIAGITFDDRDADESFLNYDHPNVAIYERHEPISRADFDLAMSWALERPWFPTREPPAPTLLLDTPVGENPSVADARWSAAWTSSTPVAIAVWLLLLGALLLAGWPIARSILPRFPDQGWGMARTLALVVAAYPVWLGASLELTRFRAVWVIVALGAVIGAGWWYARRRPVGAASARWQGWRVRLHAEAVFWLVFALFLAFRLVTPDGWHPIWGGEKAMEFAQINAVSRSAYFPPYDPWFADGYINYYYYGFYLVAFLLKAVGMPAEIGFNLALPTMMAMLAAGGFSVAAALAGGLTRSPRFAIAGGWLGALGLSVLGNLSAIGGLAAEGRDRADPFIHWTWNGSRAIENAITEFPYFTGLYADLHAHVVALPITVAAIGLALALVQSAPGQALTRRFVANLALIALDLGTLSITNAWDVPVYALLAVAAIFMATGRIVPWTRRMGVFVAASLLTVATAYGLFLPFHRHFVALFSQVALVRDPTDPLQFLSHLGALVAVAAVGLTALLLAHRRGGAVLGFEPWLAIGVVLAGVALLASSPGDRLSTAGDTLLFVGIAGPPLAGAWWAFSARGRSSPGGSWPASAIVIATVIVATVAIGLGRTVFAICFGIGAAAAVGWPGLRGAGPRFTCLLLSAAFFTAAGVEIVVVADDLLGSTAYRMNTVFKFYNQIWVLLAVAGTALAAMMLRDTALGAKRTAASAARPASINWSRGGVALAAILALASLTYPALATAPRLEQRFVPGTPAGTLDALAWMETGQVPSFAGGEVTPIAFAGDLAAIRWFQENVDGSPVVAEASIGPYRCNGSRISAATGLPTIIGWERHQQQQRYADDLPRRVEDVRRLYTSPDPAEKSEILRRYNVAYVVVGDLERIYPLNTNECSPTGSAAGIAAFAEMLGDTLEVAFAANGTTVYRVLPLHTG